MYSEIDTAQLEKAGDYVLSDIELVSFQAADGSNPKRISIRSLVSEVNIYEGLDQKNLSGTVILTDAQNVVGHLPLTGFERIEFKMFTPGTSRGYDFTFDTGHPMFIYKIADRTGVSPRTQMYKLHFCSAEMIQNEQVKVERAFTDTYDNNVLSVFRNELKSKKTMIVEETAGIRKYTSPKIRPFEVIDEFSKNAQSKIFTNAGMMFYETAIGYHFQSIESMLAISNGVARPVQAKYTPKPANIRDSRGNRDVVKEMQTVVKFQINEQFNTLKNLRNGVYNARVITHDNYNKTFSEVDFDYAETYSNSFHTEHDGKGGLQDNKSIMPLFNYKDNKFFSQFPQGTQYMVSTTENVHTDIERVPHEVNLPKRLSQRLAFETMSLTITVPGFTGISVGDLVAFEMPSYEPSGVDNPLDLDPYMSGRYLIKSIRHKIMTTADRHEMILEIFKDSVHTGYPQENVNTLDDRKNKESINVLKYDLDDALLEDTEGDGVFK